MGPACGGRICPAWPWVSQDAHLQACRAGASYAERIIVSSEGRVSSYVPLLVDRVLRTEYTNVGRPG